MSKILQEIEFGEIATFRNGLNFSKETRGVGCSLIGIPDFKDRSVPDYESLGQISPDGLAKADDYLAKGDILFVRSNGNKNLVGRSLFINEEIKALYSGFCIRARLTSEKTTPLFFFYFTKTERFKSMISSSGGTSIQNLNQEILSKVKLPLLPISDQNKITNILSALDGKIELNNKINAELEAMAKTLYDYWFVQFDFLDANGKPYKASGGKMVWNEELKREIPKGWEVKELKQILYTVNDTIEPNQFLDLKYLPIDKLPSKQLYYQEYSEREKANSSLIKFNEDDILLGAMRVYFHRVCNAIEGGISRSTIMVLRSFDSIYKNYGLFTLSKDETIDFANKNSTGTSIPYAKWENGLSNFKVVIPSEVSLKDFNKQIDPILTHFKILSKENQHLTSLRDWLLPMLMNGQVSVTEGEEKLGMVAESNDEYKRS